MASPSTAPILVCDAPSTVFMYTGSRDATMNTDAPKQKVMADTPHSDLVCSSEAPFTGHSHCGRVGRCEAATAASVFRVRAANTMLRPTLLSSVPST